MIRLTFGICAYVQYHDSTAGYRWDGGQRRTIIPSWAEANVDVRLTPGLDPQKVYNKLVELVEAAT